MSWHLSYAGGTGRADVFRDGHPLPDRLQGVIGASLVPGERVIWTGLPLRGRGGSMPGWDEAAGGVALLLLATLYTLLILSAIEAVPAEGRHGSWRLIGVGVIPALPTPVLVWFGLKGLYVPVAMRRALRQTGYALTDRRLIAASDGRGGSDRVRSLPVGLVRRVSADTGRVGDVRIGRDDVFDGQPVTLWCVEDPAGVARALRSVRRQARLGEGQPVV